MARATMDHGRSWSSIASLDRCRLRDHGMRSCFPFIVAAVCVATAHVTPATALADTAVRSIGEVLDLPLETVQRQPEVRIRGITTWRGGPFFIVQGDSEGIFIDTGKAVEQGVRAAPTIPADVVPGAIVEIDGLV